MAELLPGPRPIREALLFRRSSRGSSSVFWSSCESDFAKADRQAGITPAFRQGENPTGQKYSWHHVEDGETMQLVPSDVHSKTGHSGGADLIRRGLAPRKDG